jgi:hypothetical protein
MVGLEKTTVAWLPGTSQTPAAGNSMPSMRRVSGDLAGVMKRAEVDSLMLTILVAAGPFVVSRWYSILRASGVPAPTGRPAGCDDRHRLRQSASIIMMYCLG